MDELFHTAMLEGEAEGCFEPLTEEELEQMGEDLAPSLKKEKSE